MVVNLYSSEIEKIIEAIFWRRLRLEQNVIGLEQLQLVQGKEWQQVWAGEELKLEKIVNKQLTFKCKQKKTTQWVRT